ncbi:unnamed protein product [Brassica oleracea]
MLIFGAWPCRICESVIHLAGPPNLKLVFDDLLSVAKMQRISGGFTGAFILSLMPYFSFTKNSLPVGSPGWSLSSPYLLSMKGEEFPNSLLSSGFSFLVYESWSSKSLYVTTSMLSDFVVKATPTHSNFVSNPLSSSFEELSCLVYIVVVYVFNQRGWLIPSNRCNQAV